MIEKQDMESILSAKRYQVISVSKVSGPVSPILRTCLCKTLAYTLIGRNLAEQPRAPGVDLTEQAVVQHHAFCQFLYTTEYFLPGPQAVEAYVSLSALSAWHAVFKPPTPPSSYRPVVSSSTQGRPSGEGLSPNFVCRV